MNEKQVSTSRQLLLNPTNQDEVSETRIVPVPALVEREQNIDEEPILVEALIKIYKYDLVGEILE